MRSPWLPGLPIIKSYHIAVGFLWMTGYKSFQPDSRHSILFHLPLSPQIPLPSLGYALASISFYNGFPFIRSGSLIHLIPKQSSSTEWALYYRPIPSLTSRMTLYFSRWYLVATVTISRYKSYLLVATHLGVYNHIYSLEALTIVIPTRTIKPVCARPMIGFLHPLRNF